MIVSVIFIRNPFKTS